MILNSTLRENLLYGIQETINDTELERMLSLFKLFNENERQLDRRISNKSLSMGQMQKIAFIRALLSKVEVLILDESTSNLDEESKQLIFKILEDERLTIINSTHNKDDFKNMDLHIELVVTDDGKRKLEVN